MLYRIAGPITMTLVNLNYRSPTKSVKIKASKITARKSTKVLN